MADNAVLTKADLSDIIRRYLNGESIQTIAKDARVVRSTIYSWMHCTGEKEYPELVKLAMVRRLADADHDLSVASTKEDIARAREEARYTRWDLERRWSSQFGVKQEIKQDTSITVIVQTVSPEPFTINAQADTPTGCGSGLIEKP